MRTKLASADTQIICWTSRTASAQLINLLREYNQAHCTGSAITHANNCSTLTRRRGDLVLQSSGLHAGFQHHLGGTQHSLGCQRLRSVSGQPCPDPPICHGFDHKVHIGRPTAAETSHPAEEGFIHLQSAVNDQQPYQCNSNAEESSSSCVLNMKLQTLGSAA